MHILDANKLKIQNQKHTVAVEPNMKYEPGTEMMNFPKYISCFNLPIYGLVTVYASMVDVVVNLAMNAIFQMLFVVMHPVLASHFQRLKLTTLVI